jgi:hypothetical protein
MPWMLKLFEGDAATGGWGVGVAKLAGMRAEV